MEKFDFVAVGDVTTDAFIRLSDEGVHAMTKDDTRELCIRYATKIPYEFVEMKILDDKKSQEPNCFWCSWNRRKTIFLKAHELGCKKVAFAHHLDDLAETTLMNLFYHSKLETMNPYLEMFDGEIIIIRPLIYIAEKDIIRFAEMSNFPKSTYQCPNSITSKRAFIKNLLNEIEKQSPYVKINLFRAVTQYGDLGNILKDDKEKQ